MKKLKSVNVIIDNLIEITLWFGTGVTMFRLHEEGNVDEIISFKSLAAGFVTTMIGICVENVISHCHYEDDTIICHNTQEILS